ncbi:MAG: hypothetical protein V4844_12100 [Pseudomonadota bacterium]
MSAAESFGVSVVEIDTWIALAQLADDDFERRIAEARREGNMSTAAANLAMDFDEVCAGDA